MSDAIFQNLMRQAAHGDASGYIDMAHRAVKSGNDGQMGWNSALAHAMFWTRLAAATQPNADNLIGLADVLTAFAIDARQRGFEMQADYVGAQAIFRLEQAALLGDENAAAKLSMAAEALSPAASAMAAEWEFNGRRDDVAAEDECLRAAAKGDAQAIISIFDVTIQTVLTGGLATSDAVALLDVIGLFGKATGDAAMALRHAGVEIMRANCETPTQGTADRRIGEAATALQNLLSLVDAKEPGAADYLKSVIGGTDPRAIAIVAADRPDILASTKCAGSC